MRTDHLGCFFFFFHSALLWSAEWEFSFLMGHRGGEGRFQSLWYPLSGLVGLWSAAIFLHISLPLTLGPTSLCANHLGSIAFSAPPVWFAQRALHSILLLILCLVGPRQVRSCSLTSVFVLLVSLSCLHCSLTYGQLQMSQCADVLNMFVCWTGNPLLNYSYTISYIFKRWDLEFLSHHHATWFQCFIFLLFSLTCWWIFIVLCLDFFSFISYKSLTDFSFVVTMCFIYIKLCS